MYSIDSRLDIVSIVTERKKEFKYTITLIGSCSVGKCQLFQTTRRLHVGCSKSLSETDSQRKKEKIYKVCIEVASGV